MFEKLSSKLGGDDVKDSKIIQEHPQEQVEPPPPYSTESKQQAQGNTTYPVQAHHKQVPFRTLRMKYENWKGTQVVVADQGAEENPLYVAHIHVRKPNIVVQSTSQGQSELANVIFRWWRSKIDFNIRGAEFQLARKGWWDACFKYTSPAYGNKPLKWTSNLLFRAYDFSCETEDGVTLAHFSADSWNLKKVGKLELFGAVQENKELMEEMMVMALALIQYIIVQASAISASTVSA